MSIDLTTIFQTMPYVQNVAHAELVSPEAQLAASQAMTRQALAEQNKQTQRIEKQDEMDSVRDEEKRRGSGQLRQRRARAVAPEADEEATQASNPTPFAGHIINMKV